MTERNYNNNNIWRENDNRSNRGMALVTTTVINSILTVRNPAGNATALTITPLIFNYHICTEFFMKFALSFCTFRQDANRHCPKLYSCNNLASSITYNKHILTAYIRLFN